MKLFKVDPGSTGVVRDLTKLASFAPWIASPEADNVFVEKELRGTLDDYYLFVRGKTEYSIHMNNVRIVNE